MDSSMLANIPIKTNPSGAPPDFKNGPSLLQSQLGIGIAFIVIGSIFTTLRLTTNLKIARRLGLDDWLCVSALIGGTSYWALTYINGQRGLARHAWDVPLSIFTIPLMQRQTAILFIIAPTYWSAKSAILALYIRVFGTVTWLRRIACVWIAFMAIFYGLNIVAAGVYCVPRKGEKWGTTSLMRCSSPTWLYLTVGVFSCLADLVILVLPFPVVLGLKVSLAKKVSLIVIFGTGIILVALSVVSVYLRVMIYRGIDPTWNATALEIVTVAEILGTIAVSCAPAMSAFWLNVISPSNFWSSLKSSSLLSKFSFHMSRNSRHSYPYPDRPDSAFILRKTTYEVWSDKISDVSSTHVNNPHRMYGLVSPLQLDVNSRRHAV